MNRKLIFKLFSQASIYELGAKSHGGWLGRKHAAARYLLFFSLQGEHPVELHLVVPLPSWLDFWRTSQFNLVCMLCTCMSSAGNIWFAACQVAQQFCRKSMAKKSQSFPSLGLEFESRFSKFNLILHREICLKLVYWTLAPNFSRIHFFSFRMKLIFLPRSDPCPMQSPEGNLVQYDHAFVSTSGK